MGDFNRLSPREFVKTTVNATIVSASSANPRLAAASPGRRRYAIVGTWDRACGMRGRDLLHRYSDVLEFAGLCDVNRKRVEAAKELLGVSCPTFTDFEAMCDRVKPDILMVTTVDAFHSEYIIKGLDRGIDVMTEKPMVINEK